jgi:hypothetical protein
MSLREATCACCGLLCDDLDFEWLRHRGSPERQLPWMRPSQRLLPCCARRDGR